MEGDFGLFGLLAEVTGDLAFLGVVAGDLLGVTTVEEAAENSSRELFVIPEAFTDDIGEDFLDFKDAGVLAGDEAGDFDVFDNLGVLDLLALKGDFKVTVADGSDMSVMDVVITGVVGSFDTFGEIFVGRILLRFGELLLDLGEPAGDFRTADLGVWNGDEPALGVLGDLAGEVFFTVVPGDTFGDITLLVLGEGVRDRGEAAFVCGDDLGEDLDCFVSDCGLSANITALAFATDLRLTGL